MKEKKLVETGDVSSKLEKALEQMKEALSKPEGPHFGQFWQAREICLEQLKESLPPPLRNLAWSQVREMTEQAKRLRLLGEEEGEFAWEQIALTAKQVEKDFHARESLREQIKDPEIPKEAQALSQRYKWYVNLTKEITLLEKLGEKVHALRKEVAALSLRFSRKKELFARLSSLGDLIFPERKKLIEEVTNLFVEDVKAYVGARSGSHPKLYREIKGEVIALQSAQKKLFLHGKGAKQVREIFHEGWALMKKLEQQSRAERERERDHYKQFFDQASNQILQLQKKVEEGALRLEEAEKMISDVKKRLKGVRLPRKEQLILDKKIEEALAPLYRAREIVFEKKKKYEREKQEKAVGRVSNLVQEIDCFEKELPTLGWEKGEVSLQKIDAAVHSLPDCVEKKGLEEKVYTLIQMSLFLKQKELLASLQADRAKKVLQESLDRAKQRSKYYKNEARKSGLDFSLSLHLSEKLDRERERVGQIERMLDEL